MTSIRVCHQSGISTPRADIFCVFIFQWLGVTSGSEPIIKFHFTFSWSAVLWDKSSINKISKIKILKNTQTKILCIFSKKLYFPMVNLCLQKLKSAVLIFLGWWVSPITIPH